MPALEILTLRVTDPDAQRRFYCDVLGMSHQGDGRVGYADREAALQFVAAETPYTPQPSDLYWKIALSVLNIDLACAQLRARGVACSQPSQFRDVGYLAKVTDPEGFTVELIDHWFQGGRPAEIAAEPVDETRLGGGAHLSLVTLRTASIDDIQPDILDLGMTPLSIQPVEPYGFTLYFYGFTDEAPPKADLQAIENRTRVYQRPYTVLEIQHVHALDAETPPGENAGGYGGIKVSSAPEPVRLERLLITARDGDGSV